MRAMRRHKAQRRLALAGVFRASSTRLRSPLIDANTNYSPSPCLPWCAHVGKVTERTSSRSGAGAGVALGSRFANDRETTTCPVAIVESKIQHLRRLDVGAQVSIGSSGVQPHWRAGERRASSSRRIRPEVLCGRSGSSPVSGLTLPTLTCAYFLKLRLWRS